MEEKGNVLKENKQKKDIKKEIQLKEIQLIERSDIDAKYSDFVRIKGKSSEFMLVFGQIENANIVRVIDKVYISPLRIKGIVKALTKSINGYEKRYNIILPEDEKDFMDNGIKKNN
ncbi:DUF3467 domain-containing protein [Pectinatus frisingensis]|uniref:DUF3467 domain-containing protein n=1 Tax=Pectinatus frisingensis TaxID=865 RepID=UPI003D809C64